jgi:outer membrane protein
VHPPCPAIFTIWIFYMDQNDCDQMLPKMPVPRAHPRRAVCLRVFRRVLLFLAVPVLLLGAGSGTTLGASAAGVPVDLTLHELLRRVITHNESVQMKMLEAEIGEKALQAEGGIFEPQVVGSFEREDSRRPNNTQQLLGLGFSGAQQLNQRNTLYSGGLEFLVPSGTKLQAGYTLRELNNNLQQTVGNEFETFIGASLVQPLLKNFGPAATMVRIRLAALASDVAFEEYRRQLMLVMAQAEAAYWDLHLSQEQDRISRESVDLASKILEDNRARSEVGKSSELEVLQAQAGLSLRQSRQNEAFLKVFEGANRVATFFSEVAPTSSVSVHAVDRPEIDVLPPSLFEDFKLAYEHNPDFLIRKKQVAQEDLRVAYARNQRLPQFDLKGNYGFNGLGSSPGASHDRILDADYPAWSVGVELRVPLTGGIREKREWEAARLGRQRALLALREVEIQIANSLESAAHKVRTYQENVKGYENVVDYNQKLLEAQMARLDVGSTDSRTVLETEEKLFEAKVNAVESVVLFRKALLEMELVRGSILLSRNLDLSKKQLEDRTNQLLESGKWSDQELRSFQREALQDIDPNAVEENEALRAVRSRIQEQNVNRDPLINRLRMDPLSDQKAIEAVREEIERSRANSGPAPTEP